MTGSGVTVGVLHTGSSYADDLYDGRRNVDLAWVEEWDDDERLFLITFGESQPAAPPHPP